MSFLRHKRPLKNQKEIQKWTPLFWTFCRSSSLSLIGC